MESPKTIKKGFGYNGYGLLQQLGSGHQRKEAGTCEGCMTWKGVLREE